MPDGRMGKPTRREVDAYEITAVVVVPQELLTEGDPVAPSPPLTGAGTMEVSRQ
jgi:hypothetical protein